VGVAEVQGPGGEEALADCRLVIRELWRQHGTKILGIVTSAWSVVTGLLAYLSADPQVAFLLPHKWFVALAVGNAVLGYFTFQRGRANTKNLPP
jgi:hypothetical protein